MKLKIPVFGTLFQKIALARFARNLGTMMSLRRADPAEPGHRRRHHRQHRLGDAVRDVQDSVRNGESLTGPLAHHPVFPPMVVQMMAVGEDTGALDAMLHKIAEFYDQEVEATTEALTALIEPLMIAVPRRHHRVDDHRALHADLQDLRPDQVVGRRHRTADPPRPPDPRGRASSAVRTSPFG